MERYGKECIWSNLMVSNMVFVALDLFKILHSNLICHHVSNMPHTSEETHHTMNILYSLFSILPSTLIWPALPKLHLWLILKHSRYKCSVYLNSPMVEATSTVPNFHTFYFRYYFKSIHCTRIKQLSFPSAFTRCWLYQASSYKSVWWGKKVRKVTWPVKIIVSMAT